MDLEDERAREDLRDSIKKLAMWQIIYTFISVILNRIKKIFIGSLGRVPNLVENIKNTEPSPSDKREVISREKPKIRGLEDQLQSLRMTFSPPRPEITVFRLGKERFYSYSHSKKVSNFDDSFWASFASLYSAGENITRFLRNNPTREELDLAECEMYSILPVQDRTIFYVGKIGAPTLFLIKSKNFPIKKLEPPKEREWKKYAFSGIEMFVDHQIDLLFTRDQEKEKVAFQLMDILRISYQTGIKKLQERPMIQKGVAVFLLHTPESKLSPFLILRIEEADENLRSHIFPVWFAYDELKLIRTSKRLEEICKRSKKLVKVPIAEDGTSLDEYGLLK